MSLLHRSIADTIERRIKDGRLSSQRIVREEKVCQSVESFLRNFQWSPKIGTATNHEEKAVIYDDFCGTRGRSLQPEAVVQK